MNEMYLRVEYDDDVQDRDVLAAMDDVPAEVYLLPRDTGSSLAAVVQRVSDAMCDVDWNLPQDEARDLAEIALGNLARVFRERDDALADAERLRAAFSEAEASAGGTDRRGDGR